MPNNFAFMRSRYPEVYSALEKAEACAYSDPHNSVIKCGIAVELIIENIFRLIGKDLPTKNQNMANLIYILKKEGILAGEELDIANKADNIRSKRNKAAHTLGIIHSEAVNMLESVYSFCVWFYGRFIDRGFHVTNFKAPSKPLKTQIKEFFWGVPEGILVGKFPMPDFNVPNSAQALLTVTFPTLSVAMDLANMAVSAKGELRMALTPEVRSSLGSIERKFLNA